MDVVHIKVPPIDQKDLFKTYSYTIGPCIYLFLKFLFKLKKQLNTIPEPIGIK